MTTSTHTTDTPIAHAGTPMRDFLDTLRLHRIPVPHPDALDLIADRLIDVAEVERLTEDRDYYEHHCDVLQGDLDQAARCLTMAGESIYDAVRTLRDVIEDDDVDRDTMVTRLHDLADAMENLADSL